MLPKTAVWTTVSLLWGQNIKSISFVQFTEKLYNHRTLKLGGYYPTYTMATCQHAICKAKLRISVIATTTPQGPVTLPPGGWSRYVLLHDLSWTLSPVTDMALLNVSAEMEGPKQWWTPCPASASHCRGPYYCSWTANPGSDPVECPNTSRISRKS